MLIKRRKKLRKMHYKVKCILDKFYLKNLFFENALRVAQRINKHERR